MWIIKHKIKCGYRSCVSGYTVSHHQSAENFLAGDIAGTERRDFWSIALEQKDNIQIESPNSAVNFCLLPFSLSTTDMPLLNLVYPMFQSLICNFYFSDTSCYVLQGQIGLLISFLKQQIERRFYGSWAWKPHPKHNRNSRWQGKTSTNLSEWTGLCKSALFWAWKLQPCPDLCWKHWTGLTHPASSQLHKGVLLPEDGLEVFAKHPHVIPTFLIINKHCVDSFAARCILKCASLALLSEHIDHTCYELDCVSQASFALHLKLLGILNYLD